VVSAFLPSHLPQLFGSIYLRGRLLDLELHPRLFLLQFPQRRLERRSDPGRILRTFGQGFVRILPAQIEGLVVNVLVRWIVRAQLESGKKHETQGVLLDLANERGCG